MLSDIESCARRLQRTLMNYLLLVRVENSTEQDGRDAAQAIRGEEAAALVSQTATGVAGKAGRTPDLQVRVIATALIGNGADLRTVIEHLLENAFAYSVAGTPVLVTLESESGKPILRVKDQGRGMSAEQIGQIGVFMQFERKQFEQQGLGIGLALVQRLLERQGGRLSFESTPGKGTTAIVELRPG
jgi:signal transduction histidine kinase